MRALQIERDRKPPGRLLAIDVRPQGDGKISFRLFHCQSLLIFDLDTLGAKRGNRRHSGAKDGGAARLVRIPFAHLQQSGIQGLQADVVINLFGPLALQDHTRNASRIVPDREIRNERAAWQREHVISFDRLIGVVREDLTHTDPRMAVVDHDLNGHFLERKDLRIRLPGGGWNQHAHVRPCERGECQE